MHASTAASTSGSDQNAGADLGRNIAAYVYKHNLRRVKRSDTNDDDDKN